MIIRIDLAYDGRNFHGSQRQKKHRTVQGDIESALKKLYLEPITLHLSGRTDAGVHAIRQVGHFKTSQEIPEDKALFALSNLLPSDIKLLALKWAEDDFHARYSAKEKTYRYVISFTDDVFRRPYETFVEPPLDLTAIDQSIKHLIGEHDFFAFSNRRKGERTTIRTLHEISYEEEADKLIFRFRGDGFLYKMVRILMQYLIEVGRGKIDPEQTKQILLTHSKEFTRRVAPPQGLYLEYIEY